MRHVLAVDAHVGDPANRCCSRDECLFAETVPTNEAQKSASRSRSEEVWL
jgi:hypothetical protein